MGFVGRRDPEQGSLEFRFLRFRMERTHPFFFFSISGTSLGKRQEVEKDRIGEPTRTVPSRDGSAIGIRTVSDLFFISQTQKKKNGKGFVAYDVLSSSYVFPGSFYPRFSIRSDREGRTHEGGIDSSEGTDPFSFLIPLRPSYV